MDDPPVLIAWDDPFEHFAQWMQDALAADFIEPCAMTLATANANGRPSARQVLLKSYDRNGFVFYTNYDSRKSLDIKTNPFVSAVIWWDKLHRQIRVEGSVVKANAELSDSYFASRPRGSQISAWVSPQSQPISGREELVKRVADMTQELRNQPIPRPEFWGGYRINPVRIEFWQGRRDRLHDRLRYDLAGDTWTTVLLGA